MRFRPHFEAEIRRAHPHDWKRTVEDIEARYQAIYPDVAFARTSFNPVDRRLEFCAYLLAAIQALESRGASFQEICDACTRITESYVRPANRWQRWLKGLAPKLLVTPLRLLAVLLMRSKAGKKGHPDGFLVRIVTDPADTYGLRYGFDILECGICTLFRKHQALAYVPLLCEIDRLTSSLAGFELVRQGTLATGAAKCDFRFKIAGPKAPVTSRTEP